jgi:multidrug efflux pump subunit AcrB
VSYPIVMQTPQYAIDSLADLRNLPVTPSGSGSPQVLGGIADVSRTSSSAVVSQYDIQSLVQVYATTQNRDLGAVAADLNKIIDGMKGELPKASNIAMLGQVKTMNSAFSGLSFGLLGAIVLIYLLIVVNFQSWSDPFVIITALPAALAGIVWMLFATHTTLSVPALTGAIMCMGVATANSVLVVSFAREKLDELGDATAAALEAGFVRFRPVLVTALAMVIGMAPMALGLGEGGEQNAPLGRAVVGGLVFATIDARLRARRLQHHPSALRPRAPRRARHRRTPCRRLTCTLPRARAAACASPRSPARSSPSSSLPRACGRAPRATRSCATGRKRRRSRRSPSRRRRTTPRTAN